LSVVFGNRGKRSVLKESLKCNEATTAVKFDVVSVKRDTTPEQIVPSGPSYKPWSVRAREYEKAVWDELENIAST